MSSTQVNLDEVPVVVEKKAVVSMGQKSWAWSGVIVFLVIFIIVLCILYCLQPHWIMIRPPCMPKKCDDDEEERCGENKPPRCVDHLKLFLYSLFIAIIVSIIIGVIYGAGYNEGITTAKSHTA